MDNVTFIKITNSSGEIVEYAIITNSDGSGTSMLKSTYDEQLAQSKEIASNEASPE